MLKEHIFVLILIFIWPSSYSSDELFDIGREVWKLNGIIEGMEINSNETVDVSAAFSDRNEKYKNLVNQIHEIQKLLNILEESINLNSTKVRDSMEFLLNKLTLRTEASKTLLLTARIDRIHEEFSRYVDKGLHFASRMDELATTVAVDLEAKRALLRSFLIPDNLHAEINVLTQVVNRGMVKHQFWCGCSQTIPYVLYQLYKMAIIAEIKVRLILSYVYTYLYYKNHDRRIWESIVNNDFSSTFGHYVARFSLALDVANPLALRACDPENGNWTRNKNFYELENLAQVTIFRYRWAQCSRKSCNDVRFRKSEKCPALDYDLRTRCSGVSSQCAYLSAIEACVLKKGPYKFQYVNSTVLGSFGRNFTCPEDNGYLIQDGSGFKFNYATCACNCYKDHNFISLSVMQSSRSLNMVITGLRFHRKRNILYIQPREGTLSANGHISENSERWMVIPQLIQRAHLRSIDKDHRVFFLDSLHLPPGYALTGVKFTEVTRGTITGFAIEIFAVPFDHKSGTLHWTNQISRIAPNSDSLRGLSFSRISSLQTKLPHIPSSPINRYVKLERSELREDFGQSTLPFFDAVEVVTMPPSVLGGIEIYHKGVEGYAGFLSLRLYSIKYGMNLIDFAAKHVRNGTVIFNNSTNN